MEQRKTNESVKDGLNTETQNNPEKKKRKRISINTDNKAQLPAYKGTAREEEVKEVIIEEVVKEPDFEPSAVFNKDTDELLTEVEEHKNEEKTPD
ncbi:MAG: hypothetical protein ABIN74_05100 [Ferruginibacter sp.]